MNIFADKTSEPLALSIAVVKTLHIDLDMMTHQMIRAKHSASVLFTHLEGETKYVHVRISSERTTFVA